MFLTRSAARAAGFALLLALAAAPARAQPGGVTRHLAAGKFLVAQRDLPDPNFAESVVLLVRHDASGALGLIVNRRSRVPISRVFAALASAKAAKDLAWLGGPVGVTGAFALLRAGQKPDADPPVFGDVYFSASRGAVEKSIAAGATPATFRLYLGYSGWGPGQLERETEMGSWLIVPADAASVFDPDPDAVWGRLIRRGELRFAGLQ